MTVIYRLDENGMILEKLAEYSLAEKEALVRYVEENINNNFIWWEYPDELPYMYQSRLWYPGWVYDDGNVRLAAQWARV